MKDLKLRVLFLALIIVSLLNSGCATIQKAKKAEELEREITKLTQLINERDERINRLQELVDDQQRQLQEKEASHRQSIEKLKRELNEYKNRLRLLEREQPNLK